MKKLALVSAGILVFTLQNASAQSLFATTNDFTGWTGGGGASVAATTDWDGDGVTINGAGNNPGDSGATLFAGLPGTAGSLSLTWIAGNFSSYIAGTTGEGYNPYFMHAIDPGSLAAYSAESGYGNGTTVAYSGIMQMLYTIPDDESGGGGYFQLGLTLNYNGHFDTYFPSSAVSLGTVDGQETISATIPYTIGANPSGLTYFTMGIAYNSNYQPILPFYVDSIQVVPEPGSMTLVGIGTLALGFLARRRRA